MKFINYDLTKASISELSNDLDFDNEVTALYTAIKNNKAESEETIDFISM